MSLPEGDFDLDRFLARERDDADRALDRALEGLALEIPPALHGPIHAGVTSGGKRLRPVLAVAAWRACDPDAGPPARLHDVGVALELVHAYSLMHDDLPCMDDAPLRRGRPTPHTRFGEDRTMIAGGVLIPAAGLHLWRAARAAGIGAPRAREMIGILARAAGAEGMVGGQALDLDGEGRALGRAELDDLHARKTGALLAASLELGAAAAGASDVQRSALVRYGREIGLAFQIADDVLDATRSAEALGKHPSDTELEKSTYVRLLGIEGARSEARARVGSAIGALSDAGLDAPSLRALARFVVERGH